MKRFIAIREEHQLFGAVLASEAALTDAPLSENAPQPPTKTGRAVFFDPNDEKSLIKPPKLKPTKPSRLAPSEYLELSSFRL